MKVLEYILETLKKRKMHFTLIDPAKQSPEESKKLSIEVENLGTDAIMVGGSTNITPELMDETLKEIKSNVKIPVIIFPNGLQSISKHADAIYFMSMLNSSDRDFIIGNQVKAALLIKKIGIETIPMGYIVVEPGMTVGKVGKAILIKRDDIKNAVSYALAAQFLGMKLVYLEAGSGAPNHVPPELIKAIKNEVIIPVIVGGGIRDKESVKALIEAGADIIVTGTLIEKFNDYKIRLKDIISYIRGREGGEHIRGVYK
ncbi:MAG: geranylgeranylglyceryl/heptaprenylglyceryl phosphate synthase [Thermoplasmata archaeon]